MFFWNEINCSRECSKTNKGGLGGIIINIGLDRYQFKFYVYLLRLKEEIGWKGLHPRKGEESVQMN